MSKADKGWLTRRGQTTADTAIDQLVDLRPNERIEQVLDEYIDDSPAQMREAFSEESLGDLVQSMHSAGFTGVLLVRPHPQHAKRYELVFGHRRRAAWRIVCQEQGRPCLVPAIIRPVSDRDMLLQGAQENLAREDLSLREECNLVARLLKEFYPAGQEEVAKMIGKTRGWIAPRARVNALPAELRERLWQRPGAMSHFLELTMLSRSNPNAALRLADRIVREELSLSAVHELIKEHEQAATNTTSVREGGHKDTSNSNIVPDGTIPVSETLSERVVVREHERVKPEHAGEHIVVDDVSQDYAIEVDEVPDIDSGQVQITDLLDFHSDQLTFTGHAQDQPLARSGTQLADEDKEQLRKVMELLLRASEAAIRPRGAEHFERVRVAIDHALEVVRQVIYDCD